MRWMMSRSCCSTSWCSASGRLRVRGVGTAEVPMLLLLLGSASVVQGNDTRRCDDRAGLAVHVGGCGLLLSK